MQNKPMSIYRSYILLAFFYSTLFIACSSTAPTRQITLAPSSRYQMEPSSYFSSTGQYTQVSSPSEDRKTFFLQQNDINQVFMLQEKSDWREVFRFSSSASDYPRLVFCQNQQYFILLDFQTCYKADATVNTKTELFSYSEIAYDQAWVIWKEVPSNASKKPPTATVMNWITEEKQTILIASDIDSLRYCAGYLLISTQAKPDDAKEWWVYDTNTKKLTPIESFGEHLYSAHNSDILYWSSQEKSQWTTFSLPRKKVLQRIPFNILPDGMMVPYVQKDIKAFWFIHNTTETEGLGEKTINVELIHGMFDKKNHIQITPLLLPDAYQLPPFMPEADSCLWLQLADNANQFYRLYYSSDERYKLDEILFPPKEKLTEPAYISSDLKGPSGLTVIATKQAVYTFSVKEAALIVE